MGGTIALAIMVFGGIVALAGIVMLVRGLGKGRNAVKAFGAEFELSSSAVVVFIVGAGLMVAPFFFDPHPLQISSAPSTPNPTAVPVSSPPPTPATPISPSSPAPASPTGTAQQPAATSSVEVAEVEPNDEFARATSIPMGATVHGQLAKKDVDYYKFRTSAHYKHDVKLRFETGRDAQFMLRIYDSQKNQELDKFLAFEIAYDAGFIARPNTEYVIELENRPDWTAASYTFTLNEN